MPSTWLKNIIDYKWEIMVFLSVLFFITIIIFHNPINKWLKNKQDFSIGKPYQQVKKYIIPKKNESRCREVFEQIFQRPFPSVRPSFLKRSNGYNLELDGYNKDLNLAFEYQGIQHYKFSPRFHNSIKDYEEQVKRDIDKRKLCEKENVTLIEIPYTILYDKLEGYIREQLRNRNLL